MNAPQSGALVKLKAVEKDPLARYAGHSAKTTPGGNFQFEDVAPGRYMLMAEGVGFLRTEYGEHRGAQTESEIALKAGEKRRGLVFTLIPKHVVCGKVTDEKGEPLKRVSVIAFAHNKGSMWLSGGRPEETQTVTDDEGNYRLANLPAGEYFVWAEMSTWFNEGKELPQAEAERLANAEPVEVGPEKSKECRENIRIGPRLGYHGFHVRGKFAAELELSGKDIVLSLLEVNHAGVTQVLPPAEKFQPENSFDLWGVPAGRYRLILSRGRFPANGSPYQQEFTVLSSQEIAIGDGDANDVLVAAGPLASLGGEVRYEGIKAAAACPTREKTVLRILKEDDGQFEKVELGADGKFSFAQVPLGTYDVQLGPLRRGSVYVNSMLLDGQPVKGRKIQIATAGPHALEVVLSGDVAQAAGHIGPSEPAEKFQAVGTHPKATVSGVVKGASENEPWVKLWAMRFNSERSYEYSTKPGKDGSFHFENVDPGIYVLLTQGKDYALTEYGASYPGLEGTPLTLLAGQQVKGMVLRAARKEPRLCGRVLDEEGRALGNVVVLAARARGDNPGAAAEAGGKSNGSQTAASVGIASDGLERATTDSSGVFRFFDLKAGRYFLWTELLVQSGQEWKRRWTYYPSASSLADAKAIEVSYEGDAGCPHTIRMRSAPAFHVRGKLAGAIPNARGFDHFTAWMVETNSSGTTGRTEFGKIDGDGAFTFEGVGPGHHRMVISGRHGEPPEAWSGPQCASNFYQFVGSREVVVSSGNLDDIIVEQNSLSSVSGTLRFENIPKEWKALRLEAQTVTLTPVDESGWSKGSEMMGRECPLRAQVNAKGEYSFENVEAGVYEIGIELAGVQGDELYLQSVALNGKEIEGRRIRVTAGKAAKLAMAVSNNGGELDVRIRASGPPAEEYDADEPCEPRLPVFNSVWLIPDAMEPGGTGIVTGYPQGPGRVAMPRVPPGRYHAVAGENFNNSFHFGLRRSEDSAWGNAKFLEAMRALGTPVEVRTGQKIKLSVADETAQIQEWLAKYNEAVNVGDHCAMSCSMEGFWNGAESVEKQKP